MAPFNLGGFVPGAWPHSGFALLQLAWRHGILAFSQSVMLEAFGLKEININTGRAVGGAVFATECEMFLKDSLECRKSPDQGGVEAPFGRCLLASLLFFE